MFIVRPLSLSASMATVLQGMAALNGSMRRSIPKPGDRVPIGDGGFANRSAVTSAWKGDTT